MKSLRANLPLVIVILLMLCYAVNFSALSLLKHAAFQTHAADLGNMDQPIWNTLHGRFVEETKDDGRQSTRLTDHVEPIFALVSLSFLVYDGVESILVFQTVAIALGALPVYWLARRRLKSEWAGVSFALVYLLSPALQAANLTEFHAAPLAVAPLLFTFFFIERGSPLGMWAAALLALSVKEEIALLVLMLGLYAALFGRNKERGGGLSPVHGAALAVLSLTWFGLTTFVVIPHFSQSGQSVYVGRYESLGGSFSEALRTGLTRPWQVAALLLQGDRLNYVLGLLAGAGFMPLFWPLALLMGAPILLANLLSDYPAMFSGEFHYSAPVVPFMMIGAVCGVGWLSDRLVQMVKHWLRQSESRWGQRRSIVAALTLWVLLWALGYNYVRGFCPWSQNFEIPQVTAHHRLFQRFAAQIPPEAVISTTPPLFPHLSHRRVIYLFPEVRDAEFVLLDVSGVTDMHPNDVHDLFQQLTGSGQFGIVDAADGYILLKRGATGLAALPDAFFDFARASDPQPQYPVQVDFGGRLRLRGFDLEDRFRWRLTKVRLYWEVLQPLPDDTRPYPFFVNDQGQTVEDTTLRPMVASLWYPPGQWRPGEIVVTETTPWDLGDAFFLGVGVLSGNDWGAVNQRWPVTGVASEQVVRLFDKGTWVRLLRFERAGKRLHWTPEVFPPAPTQMDYSLQANLANQFTLLGADARREGDSLRVVLFWQTLKPTRQDYTVFVHLLAPDGALVAQHDSAPKNGSLPTSTWLEGEIVYDEHLLHLPPDLTDGDYRVEVGLYVLDSMERLPVLDASGRKVANSVTLQPIVLRKS